MFFKFMSDKRICQKQIAANTDDDYAKVEPYERKTTEER